MKTCHGCGREVMETQRMDNHPMIHSGPGGCWGPCEKGEEKGMKNLETWMSGVPKPGPVEIPGCFLAFACGCTRNPGDPFFMIYDEDGGWKHNICGKSLVVKRKPARVVAVATSHHRERYYLGEARHP